MEEEVVHGSIERLLQYGVLGVLVIVFGVTIWYLWREGVKERKDFIEKGDKIAVDNLKHLSDLRSEYDAKLDRIWQLRLADAQAYQLQFTELTKQSATAMVAVTTLLESNKEMMSDLRDAMRDLSDNIRSSRRPQ